MKLILLAALAATVPAFASVTYVCDSSISGYNGNANLCNYLNGTVASYYNSTFTNANATIYIQFANNGGLGESTSGYLNLVSYSTYQSALETKSTDSAKTTVPGTEPSVYSGGDVELTSALAGALGITTAANSNPILGVDFRPTGSGGDAANGWAGAACSPAGDGSGTSTCFNGIVTLEDPADLATATGGQGYTFRGLDPSTSTLVTPQNYDFFSVVEHETDEVLGTASCISGNGTALVDGCGGTNASATDLFRYSATNTRVFNTLGGTQYFSADGGATDYEGNTYDNEANEGDWADFHQSCVFVQDTGGCPNGSQFDITTDGPGGTAGPEVALLNAIGFNLNTSTPEPATIGLIGASLVGLTFRLRRRSARK
jgi:hypothetical protein